MEEESERMRQEEERFDAMDMQLLNSSPRLGETTSALYPPPGLLLCGFGLQRDGAHAFGKYLQPGV